ncbi:MAG: O-antigen ligase family protein, partial [Alphaproteobacteria bacterium]|nr:O-antigen ligase family protein [Alphaproteobacteria bacterium]
SAGMALLPFLLVHDRVRASRPRLAWLAGIACAGLAAVICYAGLSLAHGGTMRAAQIPAASAEAVVEQAPQRDQLTDLDDLTGRTRIWSAALRTVAAYPTLLIKGATLERLMLTVESQAPEIKGFLHLHNTYLTVLIGMGLPALLLLLGFLFLLLRCGLRLVLRPDACLGERFLPAILLGSLIVGMAEPFYFTGQYFMDRLFFLVAGFVVTAACAPQQKDEAIQNR